MFHQRKSVSSIPIADSLQEASGLFYLLALLSGFPQMRELHTRHAIPSSVVRDTLADIRLYLDNHHKKYSVWGLNAAAVNWLAHHIRGELYRLGRLQFMFGTYAHKCIAYQHHTNAAVVVLAEDGCEYRKDGQLNGAGGVVVTSDLWTSQLTETEQEVCGNPINPATGSAVQQALRLHKTEWMQVLAPGDPILEIHIPEGEPLTIEACRKSLDQALDFFPQYFHEKPFQALVCVSWLCDAQLEHWLPPASNIVSWLQQFYLFPVESDAWSALRSVFGCEIPYGYRGSLDASTLPRATSLQRALLNHLENGGHWRKGGALFFPEDVEYWGRQAYRSFTEEES